MQKPLRKAKYYREHISQDIPTRTQLIDDLEIQFKAYTTEHRPKMEALATEEVARVLAEANPKPMKKKRRKPG